MTSKQKLRNIDKILIQLTPRVRSIIIGLILSDGWLQKRGHWNPRLGFKQSIVNFPYFWHIYNELAYLCSGLPSQTGPKASMSGKTILRGKLFFPPFLPKRVSPTLQLKRGGQRCAALSPLCIAYAGGGRAGSVALQSRQLDCINEIFKLFYVSKKGQLNKRVKPELFFYMDYIVLAHWIMGDGSRRNNGITLCTDNFTLQEVVLLMNILILKFDINPTLHSAAQPRPGKRGKFRIYINKRDLKKIRPYILPYFVDLFLYKIS